MHRVYLSLALALAALTAAPTLAQPNPSVSTAPALYKHAVKNLDDGHWFESAITDLTQAVKLDPDNSDYHLALGCAEVDRAGSIAYAAFMTDQLLNAQANYKEKMRFWHLAQSIPQSPGYGTTPPIAPPNLRFQVKDDLHHLTLTGKQAVAQVVALGTTAQGEWRLAVTLAKTPQARAQSESVQGWGLLYEQRILKFTDYSVSKMPSAPKTADVIAAFQAATKDDPTNAAYWEGLGDAYPYSYLDNTSHATDIIHAWQKALTLAPGNAGLGFRLYRRQGRHDSQAALTTLKSVAASDPDNSLLQYGLADLLFKQVHYDDVVDRVNPALIHSDQIPTQEQAAAWRKKVIQDLAAKDDTASEQIASDAIDDIERGNAGSHADIPDYAPPVPKILQHAWHYWDTLERQSGDNFESYSGFYGRLRALARAVGGYSVVAAQLGNHVDAMRAADGCIIMGQKLAGNWPVRDETPDGSRVAEAMLGVAVSLIGKSDLQLVYEEEGSALMAQEMAREVTALKQKLTAYIAAVMKAGSQAEATHQVDLWKNY